VFFILFTRHDYVIKSNIRLADSTARIVMTKLVT